MCGTDVRVWRYRSAEEAVDTKAAVEYAFHMPNNEVLSDAPPMPCPVLVRTVLHTFDAMSGTCAYCPMRALWPVRYVQVLFYAFPMLPTGMCGYSPTHPLCHTRYLRS